MAVSIQTLEKKLRESYGEDMIFDSTGKMLFPDDKYASIAKWIDFCGYRIMIAYLDNIDGADEGVVFVQVICGN